MKAEKELGSLVAGAAASKGSLRNGGDVPPPAQQAFGRAHSPSLTSLADSETSGESQGGTRVSHRSLDAS